MNLTFALQRSQRSTSMPNTRFNRFAQPIDTCRGVRAPGFAAQGMIRRRHRVRRAVSVVCFQYLTNAAQQFDLLSLTHLSGQR